MKSLVLLTIAALTLSFGQLQNKGNLTKPLAPVITSIDPAMAYETGSVTIHGRQFGLVTRVLVNGNAVPMVRNTGHEIVIQPGDQIPGFARLELVQPGNITRAAIEFNPSLQATRRGNEVTITLRPLEAGYAWVNWSYRCLAVPSFDPKIYYQGMLDMTASSAGVLFVAKVRPGETLVQTVPVPGSLLGGPFRFQGDHWVAGDVNLQGFCLLGSEPVQCYTNMVSLPLAGP